MLREKRQAKPGSASTPILLPDRGARRAAILNEIQESRPIDTTAGVTAADVATFSEPTTPAPDTGSPSCEPTQPVLSRLIQEWWGLAAHDVPANWTDELPEHDRARLDRMRVALGLPDSRAMLVHLIRWLVIGHRTAWLGQPLGKGVQFWLDNLA